jgi:hypothetical protein
MRPYALACTSPKRTHASKGLGWGRPYLQVFGSVMSPPQPLTFGSSFLTVKPSPNPD